MHISYYTSRYKRKDKYVLVRAVKLYGGAEI
jgi:hypothetical protein